MTTLLKGDQYFLAWERSGRLYVQRGTVGSRAAVEEVHLTPDASPYDTLQRLLAEECARGYRGYQEHQLIPLVIHFPITNWESEDVTMFEQAIHDLVGNQIGLRGVGYYDGFTRSPTSLNVWALVINPMLGVELIRQVLDSHGYLDIDGEPVVIAHQSDDRLVIAYPPARRGQMFA